MKLLATQFARLTSSVSLQIGRQRPLTSPAPLHAEFTGVVETRKEYQAQETNVIAIEQASSMVQVNYTLKNEPKQFYGFMEPALRQQ